jgi:thiol:disulfide interchange protein DsbD
MLATFLAGAFFAACATAEIMGLALPLALLPSSPLAKPLGAPGAVNEGGAGQSSPKLDWKPFANDLLASAIAAKKPVILDFSAEWCAACKELERYTFSDPRVRERSREFLLLEADATVETPLNKELQKRFGVMGLPTLIFFDIEGRRRNDLTATGFEPAEIFLERMNGALKAP